MKVDFDDTQDSVAQARLLVNALTEWLAEQALGQPPRSGKTRFCYRPDGTLDSLTVTLDEDAEQ